MNPFLSPFAALCIALAASAQDSKPASDAPLVFDLRAPLQPYAVQIDWTMTAKGSLTTTDAKGVRTTTAVDDAVTYRVLDEIVERAPAPARTTYRRTILESQRTRKADGPADDGSAGTAINYVENGGDVSYELAGECTLSDPLLTRIGEAANFVGANLHLSTETPIGVRRPYRSLALLRTMIEFDGEIKTHEGWLQLDAVDAKSRRARLAGVVICVEERGAAGKVATAQYELNLKIEFDLDARLPVSIDMEGRMLAEGRDAPKSGVGGDVKFAGRLTVAPVKNAAALRKAKPVHRDVRRRWGGATFLLPSCWMKHVQTDEAITFIDSRFAHEKYPSIEVRRFEDSGDVGSAAFMTRVTSDLRSTAPDAKVDRAAVGTAQGLSFSFTTDGGKTVARGYVMKGDAGAALMFTLSGPAESVKKVEPDLKKAAGSVQTGR